MNYNKFIALFTKKRDIEVNVYGGKWYGDFGIINDTYNGVPWWFRNPLAESMSTVDFKCGFKNGKCIRERDKESEVKQWAEDNLPENRRHVNFCCSTCCETVGNLTTLPNDEEDLKEVASLFDPDIEGFWRPEKGCILPHKYRSTLCLIGRCYYIRGPEQFTGVPRMSKEDLQKVYNLTNAVMLYKKYLKENQ